MGYQRSHLLWRLDPGQAHPLTAQMRGNPTLRVAAEDVPDAEDQGSVQPAGRHESREGTLRRIARYDPRKNPPEETGFLFAEGRRLSPDQRLRQYAVVLGANILVFVLGQQGRADNQRHH
jgi:hypothetical protein